MSLLSRNYRFAMLNYERVKGTRQFRNETILTTLKILLEKNTR